MTNIIDFIKHKTDKEVEEYIESGDIREDDIMCYGCPECENPTFMITVEKEILCTDCGEVWGVDE